MKYVPGQSKVRVKVQVKSPGPSSDVERDEEGGSWPFLEAFLEPILVDDVAFFDCFEPLGPEAADVEGTSEDELKLEAAEAEEEDGSAVL